MQAPAAYFLVGPTASGKSDVAQWMAEREGFDILSADSMCVYRGMDIGTAKPTPADRGRVTHWALDEADPGESFSVGAYLECARQAWAACAAQGRRLLVAGGTGLYVKGLTEGLSRLPAADPDLRRRWSDVLKARGVAGLQAALRERDPGRLETLSDPQNSRRLIRALELAEAGAAAGEGWTRRPADRPVLAGLCWPRPALHARIEARVRAMYARGLIEETVRLLAAGLERSPTASQAIGYAEAAAHIRGTCTLEAAIARTIVRTRQLAKRQMTWFRNQANVCWISLEEEPPIPMIAARVAEAWSRHGPTPLHI
jgi:tRNA dimethylallyltransferase